MTPDAPVDLAIVGAGGAGLSVLTQLDRLLPAGARAPSVVLVDPVHRAGTDRTWCFWDDGVSDVEPAVSRSWRRVEVRGPRGEARLLDLAPMRYAMVRSADFYQLAEKAVARLGVQRVVAAVDRVEDDGEGAVVHTPGGRLRAAWVLDSRPGPPRLPPNTLWRQHFRGWTVRLSNPVLDPEVATLMDFATPQPPHGVAFCYVLPTDPRTALVEYTVFSRERFTSQQYDDALRGEVASRWPGEAYEVLDVEDGEIPMSDAVLERRPGRRVVRIGIAGGATRRSTGYTFAAMQRQAGSVAAALLAGRDPVPPPAYPARHQWMDAVLLRALDRSHTSGAGLFADLFARNPTGRVMRFMDGRTTWREDVALMATTPWLPMARAGAGDALARALRRVRSR